MKTIEVEIAVMEYLDIRINLVVPNISWGCNLHECDILSLTKSGYATEIEIKISKADLLKDKEKRHGHISKRIANFYYAVPEKLEEIALKEIPERAGLLVIKDKGNTYIINRSPYRAILVKECRRNPIAEKWDESDRLQLARLGTMRILGLKKKIASK